MAGWLFTALNGDYPKVGTICSLIYGFGIIAIWFAPDTSRKMIHL